MTAEVERKAIRDLWPAHIPHLVPAENRMGQPYTDTEHGIVCNCGDVLGWPENAPQPAEVVEHQYDAAADQSAMAGHDNPETQGYEGPPRPGDLRTYTDPSGVQWESTLEHPHPDDPRFHAVPEPPKDEYGDDPADEAQASRSRQPVTDVQLPAVAEDPADVIPVLYQGNPQDIDAVRAFAKQAGVAMSDDPPGFDGQLPSRPAGVAPVADPLSDRVTIIDPTLPYGPEQVEHQLIRIEGQIERGIHFQRFWEERLHYAKVAFELANARALIAATGGDAGTRKAQALLACEQEYTELAVCETMVRSVRECMHSLRSLLSGYQTVSRSVDSSMRGPGGHGA